MRNATFSRVTSSCATRTAIARIAVIVPEEHGELIAVLYRIAVVLLLTELHALAVRLKEHRKHLEAIDLADADDRLSMGGEA